MPVLKINSVFLRGKQFLKFIRHSFLVESECPESVWKLFELEVRRIVQLFVYLREGNESLTQKVQMGMIQYCGAFPKKFSDIRSKYFVGSEAELLLQLKSSIRFIKAFRKEQRGSFTQKNIEVFLRSLWKFVFVIHFNKEFDNQFSESLKFLFEYKEITRFEDKLLRIRLVPALQARPSQTKKFEKFAIGVTLSASVLFFFLKLD